MNTHVPRHALLLLVAVSASLLRAVEAAPRLADSAEAQRLRDLTLIGGAAASASPAERALAKARVLSALYEALQARLTAIDARLGTVAPDDPAAARLNLERSEVSKRKEEVGRLLMGLPPQDRGQGSAR